MPEANGSSKILLINRKTLIKYLRYCYRHIAEIIEPENIVTMTNR